MATYNNITFTQAQRDIHRRIAHDRDNCPIEEGFSWSEIKIYRAYAAGKHLVCLSDRQKEILKGLVNGKFCDNFCGQVVDEAAGRIQFVKWTCKNEAVDTWLAKFYAIRKIDSRQSTYHYKSLRDGNFAVAVNWSTKDNYPQTYREEWWDGTRGVYIHYGTDDEPEYAVKEWTYYQTGQSNPVPVTRRLVWYEDSIEKWESSNPSAWDSWLPAPHDDDITDGVANWPLPWLDVDGQPMGIPYVHLPNAAKTNGMYGVSELAGGLIGFQDHLNDAQYSLTITGRLTGAQQYYGTGIKLKSKDGTSEKIPIRVDAGMFHTSENEKSTFGVLPAGSTSEQINGYLLKLKRGAQISRTPLHAITGGDWPSGDALLRAELPAVNKASSQIKHYKGCWVDIAVLAIKLFNKFSPEDQRISYDIKDGIIEAVFDDPEHRDIVSRSIVVHNSVGFISIKEGLRILGKTNEQANEIYNEVVEEQAASADAMATAVLGGKVTGTSSGGALGGGNNKPGSSAA